MFRVVHKTPAEIALLHQRKEEQKALKVNFDYTTFLKCCNSMRKITTIHMKYVLKEARRQEQERRVKEKKALEEVPCSLSRS
jgi:hypothetical protein